MTGRPYDKPQEQAREIMQLSLVKGEERYIFRYYPGEEEKALKTFLELARDDNSSFDFFDAAILSYQMGIHLETEPPRK